MDKKKSSFYHARWHRAGLSPERAADLLGVTVDQIHILKACYHCAEIKVVNKNDASCGSKITEVISI